jgi:hypothetical protein
MREIKFRAWDKQENNMKYNIGDKVYVPTNKKYVIPRLADIYALWKQEAYEAEVSEGTIIEFVSDKCGYVLDIEGCKITLNQTDMFKNPSEIWEKIQNSRNYIARGYSSKDTNECKCCCCKCCNK